MDWANVNWDAVLAIAQIVGDVGVFLSLVYVALQIRDDARARRAQTVHQLSHSLTDISFAIACYGDLAEIVLRGSDDLKSLSRTELSRFQVYHAGLFRTFDNVYFQYRDGSLNEQIWEGMEKRLEALFRSPGLRDWWVTASAAYSQELQGLVAGKLAGVTAEAQPSTSRAAAT